VPEINTRFKKESFSTFAESFILSVPKESNMEQIVNRYKVLTNITAT
jgi:hypothetical protein